MDGEDLGWLQSATVSQTRCREKVRQDLVKVHIFTSRSHYNVDKVELRETGFARIGIVGNL